MSDAEQHLASLRARVYGPGADEAAVVELRELLAAREASGPGRADGSPPAGGSASRRRVPRRLFRLCIAAVCLLAVPSAVPTTPTVAGTTVVTIGAATDGWLSDDPAVRRAEQRLRQHVRGGFPSAGSAIPTDADAVARARAAARAGS